MGLKKYDESKEQSSVEEKEKESKEALPELEKIIEENSAEEESLKDLPLDVAQKEVSENIEKGRQEYFTYSKKQRTINTIISISVLAIIIGCFVLIMALGQTYSWLSYLCLAIMVVALIGTFVFTKVIKNKLTQKAEDYIALLYKNVDEYLFRSEEFSELDVKYNGQIKDEIFFDGKFYKNLKGTKSRNLVSVKYKSKQLVCCDMAANVLVKNRLSPMFLGKFYDYTSSYDKDDKRIMLQIKGGQLSRPIDDVDDLKLVEGNNTYLVYTDDEEWRKVLNKSTLEHILALKIDKTLIDVIISIRKGKVSIGIDYVDEFMNIPVEKEFDFNSVKRTENDLNKVLKILDDLN